jgi:hypothetical protein
VIGLAGEKRPGFEGGDVRFSRRQLAVEVFQKFVALLSVGFFPREADVCIDVARDGRQLLVRANLFLGAFAVTKNDLCFFLVVPEIGLRNASFERLQAFAVLRRVKESSGRA